MEFTFTPARIIIFVSLLVLFFLLDGFSPPDILDPENQPRYRRGSWIYLPALFIAGAASATLIDHWAGNIDPTNLRILYILIGLLTMGTALVLNQGLHPLNE